MLISYEQGSDCHPSFQGVYQFDRKCKSCILANGEAVFGAGPDNLSDVRLIIISDHTGYYETKENAPMVTNDDTRLARYNRKAGAYTLEQFRNAGSMLRYTLSSMFGLDTYDDCWITNMIKCDPRKVKPMESHAKDCGYRWFRSEISILDEYAPEAPILIAGNLAFKGLKNLYPELKKTLPSTLHNCRRTSEYFLGNHPLVFTVNPAAVAKSDFRIETQVGLNHNDTYRIQAVKSIEPPIVGSPIWMFREDLKFLPFECNANFC
jgi:uracil-DNA glycosylase